MGAGDEGSQVIQRRYAGPLGLIGISGVALEVRLADCSLFSSSSNERHMTRWLILARTK